MKIKATNVHNGKEWTEENTNHAWNDMCLDMQRSGAGMNLIWCDIECILQGPEGNWYMLDECGNWAYIPDFYNIEVVA